MQLDFDRMELPVIDCGPDWLTATVKRDEGRWQEVQNNWADILHRARAESGLVEDAGRLGYAGLLAGKCFWGFRWDGALLNITGGDAAAYWDDWQRATGKPTRIDLQVTVRAREMWLDYLNHIKGRAEEAAKGLKGGRKRNIRRQDDIQDGYTLYIGSRSSDTFCRVYHKYAADPDRYEMGDVRFEVELHGDQAAIMLQSLEDSNLPVSQYAIGYVSDWLHRRGVRCPWHVAEPVNSKFTDVLEQNPLDAKLTWLYNQVGPTARLLGDQGHTAKVLRVLFGPQWLEYLLGRLTEEGGQDDGTNG